ncbi:hypothetical protein ACFLY4_07470 [Chloroflexota bacterium]
MGTEYNHFRIQFLSILLVIVFVLLHAFPTKQDSIFLAYAQGDDPSPPTNPAKLIFIHHSTGENWLADDYGKLGRELEANNYFVSDTNYGWGPNGNGDRTDIINWQEWFRSPDTPTIMEQVYKESDQWDWDGWHYYTRNMPDPGGENEIIVFKSCFPNSELSGNPNDPPTPGSDFTVGNAKYIYNDLLSYFQTRRDKLFVIITAPPVQDSTYADNARGFNMWLVNDWLEGYEGDNVVVWDFFNVLTGSNHHHRFANGQVEHVFESGANTLDYPSDDDHPSAAGSQKATEEFVPMLNLFYNRWKTGASDSQQEQDDTFLPSSDQPSPEPAEPALEATKPPAVSTEPAQGGELGVIDDFESEPIAEANWVTYWDESVPTSINCAIDSGQANNGDHSLQLDFQVVANSWATCELAFSPPANWSGGKGLSFYLRTSQPDMVFDVLVFGGTPDSRQTYTYTLETRPESVDGWTYVEIPWNHIHRVDWEANAGAPFSNPEKVLGVAFGIGADEDTDNIGTIWFDDLALMSETAPIPPAALPAEEEQSSPSVCPGSVSLVLLVVFSAAYFGKHRILDLR